MEIGAHAFEHHLPVDVDHVAVAHLAAIDDVGELHARAQLVALHVHGQDADLAPLHVLGDRRRQVAQRPLGDLLEDERLVGRADLLDLVDQAGRDVLAIAIGNHRHALVRLDVEADADRIPGARRQAGIERGGHLSKFYSPACVSATMY